MNNDSAVSDIIAKHGLKKGDVMKNVVGEDIADSRVLNPSTCIIAGESPYIGRFYEVIHEEPISGNEIKLRLSRLDIMTIAELAL